MTTTTDDTIDTRIAMAKTADNMMVTTDNTTTTPEVETMATKHNTAAVTGSKPRLDDWDVQTSGGMLVARISAYVPKKA